MILVSKGILCVCEKVTSKDMTNQGHDEPGLQITRSEDPSERSATVHVYALVRRQAAARRQQLSGSAGHSSLKEFRISLGVRYLSESSISLKEFDAPLQGVRRTPLIAVNGTYCSERGRILYTLLDHLWCVIAGLKSTMTKLSMSTTLRRNRTSGSFPEQSLL